MNKITTKVTQLTASYHLQQSDAYMILTNNISLFFNRPIALSYLPKWIHNKKMWSPATFHKLLQFFFNLTLLNH